MDEIQKKNSLKIDICIHKNVKAEKEGKKYCLEKWHMAFKEKSKRKYNIKVIYFQEKLPQI